MAGEVLSDKQIRRLIEGGAILNADYNLVNASSLDLTLGVKKWRLLGSVLPLSDQTVIDLIENLGIVDDKHFLESEFYIDKDQPYLFELNESLNLPPGVYARIFNKSGRGRVGTSVRGVVDKNSKFDDIPNGYKGKLYAEVCATVFPEVIIGGQTTMPQIRFYDGYPQSLIGADLQLLLRNEVILLNKDDVPINFSDEQLNKIARKGSLIFTADLSRDLLVYKAKLDKKAISMEKKAYYDPEDFFEEIRLNKRGDRKIIIHPGEFVLIHSKEKIRLPPGYAAEISDYSSKIGDMKAHYAGLINPGHGYVPDVICGDHIVFEVRARDIPICIQDGQRLANFEIFRMSEIPEIEYKKVQSTDFDSLPSILPKQFKKIKEIDRPEEDAKENIY
jgi:dCTP deaminase